ncbi:hypothetical protein F5B20DRAFT_585171 [Whalleya microplaca]|nr:hypothetical protein F5B20DRAFT_585171 [Whalleya microplaca]
MLSTTQSQSDILAVVLSTLFFSLSLVTKNDSQLEYVLRFPESEEDDLPRTAAILEYLNETTDLKVPKVITWDATKDNPLDHNYIILSRIPGKNIGEVWDDLTQNQKIDLAKELAQLFLQIEKVTSPVAGEIMVHEQDFKHGDDISTRIFVQAFGTEVPDYPDYSIDWFNKDSGILSLERLRHDPPGLSVNDIMVTLFKRRMYQAENRKPAPESDHFDYFRPCQLMIEDMIDRGLFEPENDVICLLHSDLYPQNIMVDFTPNLVITGVLDWDNAKFGPRFAGRVPPWWLWHEHHGSKDANLSTDYIEEPWDPKEWEQKYEPDSPENAEIKKAFEDAAGEGWVAEATKKHYPFARNLLHFSQTYLYDGNEDKKAKMWKEKWDSLWQDTSPKSEEGEWKPGVSEGPSTPELAENSDYDIMDYSPTSTAPSDIIYDTEEHSD